MQGDAVMRSLRQAWWAPVAALLAVVQLIMSPLSLASDEDLESRVASLVILLVGGVILAIGLILRPSRLVIGNVLLLAGCAFALFWFWTLFLPIGGIVVAVGVLLSGWHAAPATESG